MNSNELQERLEALFEELRIANESFPIIVEGKNDEAALRKLGAKGTILRLNTGQSILDFCEAVARKYNEIILLPDWDKKGIQLFKKLKHNFKYTNVKSVKKFWRDFKRYCSKDVHEVEYLTKFLVE